MNNKGFAITTVIYGLSILGIMLIIVIMGSLSTNRSNIKSLSRDIDNELNFYSRASISYSYTEDNELQQFEVPVGQSGWYRIELWGASGNGTSGGKGAYVTGIVWLQEGQMFFIKVGGSTEGKPGGSTDIRIIESNEKIGLASRLMVAAGGGTEIHADGGTLCGYNTDMFSSGGAIKADYSLDTTKTTNYFGTLYPNKAPKNTDQCLVGSKNGHFKSNDFEVSKSGDGYYVSNATGAEGYGGASYISGYAGVKPITSTDPTVRKTVISGVDYDDAGNQIIGEDTYDGYDVNILDGLMVPGVKSGDGAAKIEKLSVDAEKYKNGSFYYNPANHRIRTNEIFNQIKQIKICSDSTINKVELLQDGENELGYFTRTTGTDSELNCDIYSRSSANNYFDELVIWHEAWKDIGKELVYITYVKDGEDKTAKLDLTNRGTENLDGIRLSAYQPNYYTGQLLDPEGGNYYIFSVLSENKVVSAQQSNDSDFNPVKLDGLVGESRQKWSITAIPDKLKENPSVNNEYSIVELTRYGALKIELDENMAKNKVVASDKFNNLARNAPQIWKIIPNGNGTFRINTPVTYFDEKTGSLLGTTSRENGFADHPDDLIIAGENANTARFWFYKLDY